MQDFHNVQVPVSQLKDLDMAYFFVSTPFVSLGKLEMLMMSYWLACP